MKNKISMRIGMWNTPPCIRKCLTSLKALTLLLVMLMSVNVWGEVKTLIIDGSKLTSTATTAATDYTYGDFTITMSDGAKSQSSSGDNKFADNAILIGKSGKYIYNKTPFGKKITKFELYANKGASTKVSVGVLFSTTAISAYATGTNTYTATLSTLDNVYDCSAKIPDGAKYFWYQVTNANNSQVMFRVTYEEEEEDPTKPSLSVSPTTIDFGTVAVGGSVVAQDVTATLTNTDYAIATLSGTNADAFEITAGEELTETGTITVQPKATTLTTEGTYSATLEVEAEGVDDPKTVTISLVVVKPFTGNTWTLDKDDFTTGGYGSGTKTVDDIEISYTDVYQNSNAIQFKKTSGVIYNTTDFGKIEKIEITKTGNNNLNVYPGTSSNPTENAILGVASGNVTTYTFPTDENYGYFAIGKGSGASNVTPIKVFYYPIKSDITIDDNCENGSVFVTSPTILTQVASGTEITLGNTPADGYKLDDYDVYKTGESSTKVTVKEEDGVYTFKMPAYDVTISATFSLSIETPTLSEAAGDKDDAINVKVSNYNGDYSYYYTLDGTEPSNASTPYVDADGVAINASCTLKVIAYKGDVTSPVVSAAYNLPLMTMDAIFAKATAVGSTATAVRVKFTECVVTGVSGDNVYLTDNAGKGLIIYQSGHGFVVNDKLNGVVNVQLLLYRGSSEIKGLTSSTDGLTVTKDGSVSPITTMSIASLSGVNTGAVLSYTNLIYDNGYFSDGENTIQPYNTFKIADYPDFADGDKYNVTGVYIQYNTTKEIAPRSLDDLEKIEATKYAINLSSVEHGSISTTPETEAADGIKVTLSATPDASYMLGEWIVTDADGAAVTVTNNQFTMPAKAVTVSATFVELPIWATTYTSNVTVGTDKVKLVEAYQPADYPEDGYDAKKDGTSSKAAAISIKVPANTTGLHYHLFAWNGEGGKTVTIKKGEVTLKTFENVADASISGNSPYTLENNPADAYGYVALEGITEETTITFSTASGNQRIVLFGVNAVQPAAITIAPAEKNFGEVKQGFDAEQVFTLTPNAFATGTITAEIEGEGFSASAVENNEVTVTFAPTEIKDYNATLVIKHDGTQMCTATLSGKGIAATTPEIAVSDDEIDFGKVKQDATVADQIVTVTLSNLDAATASISEGNFSIDKTALVAGENTITISATASSTGVKNATITIEGTGATTKTIAVKMDVTSKWAGEYTSNVKVESDKVIIAEEEYEAVKAGTGKVAGSTTITVPEGAYALHFHAAGWNNEDVTLSVKNGDTELGPFDLYKDAGVTGNSPFTLQGENYDTDQYFYVEFDALEEETTFTFAATSGNRFVLYGVNQEGGVLPVLDHITIDGEATKLNYNTTDAFDPVGLTVSAIYTLKGVEQAPVDVTDKVDWTFDPATFNTVGEGLSVTATASFTDGEVTKTAEKVITGISVEEATPSISASKVNIEFGEVIQGATVEPIQSKITLKYIAEVSVTLSDATAFAIDKESMTETGYLTISAKTSAAVGEYTATVTIKDLNSETSKVLNLSITIKEAPHPAIYSLVTDASTLKAGDVIVMAATYSGNTYVNGALSGDLLTCVDATITNGKLTAIGACEFTLGGEADAWTLTSVNGALGATAVKKLTYDDAKIGFVGTWTISIDENNNATIAPDAEGYGRFMYNHNNGGNRFLTYTSNTSASMLLPQIYRLGVDGETNASTLPIHADVTVNEGGNLLVTEGDIELGDVYVMEGGKVTIQGTATLTVNNFVIKSTMGAGQSGQVLGVNETNLVITGEAYFDVTLGANGTNTQWHAFAVPFNVDAINGIYDLDNNKLTNEVNYAIMDYHGDVRAQGQYGWKKFRGIMNPGVFYIMATDGYRTTYRMKMDGGFSYAENNISVTYYTGAGQTTDAGWNGIANNQLNYVSVDAPVQVLNPVSYTFVTMTESSTNFTVGTPFFYQAGENGTITMEEANAGAYYAPHRVGAAEIKNVAIRLSNAKYTDHLYVSATDEATNEYQIGHDLAKMTMTNTPSVPQIFAQAYGTQLSMIDAPMVNNEVSYTLLLYAPQAGEYTISAAQVEGYEIFLTKDGNVIWNLSMSNATIELNKGNNTGYGITIKQSHKVTTDAENAFGDSDKVQKFIFNDNLYIIRNSQVFDAQGKLVK